eukprot:725568_1
MASLTSIIGIVLNGMAYHGIHTCNSTLILIGALSNAVQVFLTLMMAALSMKHDYRSSPIEGHILVYLKTQHLLLVRNIPGGAGFCVVILILEYMWMSSLYRIFKWSEYYEDGGIHYSSVCYTCSVKLNS